MINRVHRIQTVHMIHIKHDTHTETNINENQNQQTELNKSVNDANELFVDNHSEHSNDMSIKPVKDFIKTNLNVGMTFVGKEDALAHINSYCNSNFSPLIIRSSNKTRSKSLLRLFYKCPHGVEKRSKSSGKRKCEVAAAYVGCPLRLAVNQQEDGTFVVDIAVLEHKNHEVGREMFARYPINRRLSKDHQDAVRAFLDTDPHHAEVANLLRDLTGIEYSTKDAYNIVKKLKRTKSL